MARRKFIIHRDVALKLPNGRTHAITYIEHPGAVIIAPLLNPDTVVMMRQYRPAIGQYLYELPAGTRDPGESLLKTARRELREETGYGAAHITKLGQIYPVPGYSTEIIHLYKAEGLIQGIAQPEAYEVIKLCFMSRSKVANLFRQGKIVDAKSICVFAHLGWLS